MEQEYTHNNLKDNEEKLRALKVKIQKSFEDIESGNLCDGEQFFKKLLDKL